MRLLVGDSDALPISVAGNGFFVKWSSGDVYAFIMIGITTIPNPVAVFGK